jgi:parvulin-like peptidyl-prolyl isomerase
VKRRLAGVVLILIVASLASLVAACKSGLPNDAVAKVGDVYVTLDEFNKAAAWDASLYGLTPEADPDTYRSLQEWALENLVMNELAAQEAERLGLTVTDEELQTELDGYLAYYQGDQAAIESALAQAGLTWDEFRELSREGLLRGKVKDEVTKDVAVTEQEIADYYEANKTTYYVKPSRQMRHILIVPQPSGATAAAVPTTTTSSGGITQAAWDAALATAEQVRRSLVSSGDWDGLAGQYSGDPSTKDSGGDLGTVHEGQMLESFEEVAFALQLDEISDPIQTPYGYEIIQVTSITVGGQKTLDEVKSEIESTLLSQAKDEAWNTWVEAQKVEAGVVYREDLPLPTSPSTTSTTASSGPTTTGPASAETTTTKP